MCSEHDECGNRDVAPGVMTQGGSGALTHFGGQSVLFLAPRLLLCLWSSGEPLGLSFLACQCRCLSQGW